MNKVILSGRLTKDPVVNYTNGGMSIARFTLASDRQFKKEGQPSADFISCVAFGKTGEFIEKYFSKGSGIELCGRIQTGSYKDKDDKTIYTTDVIVESVEFPKGSAKAEKKQTNDDFINIAPGTEEALPF